MKQADVVVGATYIVKVSGRLVPVRLESASPYGGWVGRSTVSGREIRIRSAQKLRRPYTEPVHDYPNGCVLVHTEWGFLSTLPTEGSAADWSYEPLHAHRFTTYDEAASARAKYWFGSEHIKVRHYDRLGVV